jgi:hypothetical protein
MLGNKYNGKINGWNPSFKTFAKLLIPKKEVKSKCGSRLPVSTKCLPAENGLYD